MYKRQVQGALPHHVLEELGVMVHLLPGIFPLACPYHNDLYRKRQLDQMCIRDSRKGVHELFSQIMTISRRLQYRLLAEHGKGGDTGFTMVDELKREGARIVYQLSLIHISGNERNRGGQVLL